MASSDIYFAVLPETVLYADISHAAVRCYAVLRRHADKDDSTCFPGRARIAKLARMSTSHVDRAIQELVSIGALQVVHRRSPDNPKQMMTNQYRLLTPPACEDTPLPPVGIPSPAGEEVTIAIEPESRNQKTYDQLAVDQAFDTFWHKYPRKVGRKKCLQWWNRHATLNHDTILDALEGWVSYWEVAITDNRYIPHPYTWLHQERFNDPAPAVANARTDVVLAVLEDILDTQPALEAHNDPF
jgi:hypothetical protein